VSPLLALAERLRDSQFLRFLAVGGLNTLFGYGLFSLLVLATVTPGVALFAVTVAGILFNYFTTGQLVFLARGLRRLPHFAAFYLLTFFFNLWSLRLLQSHGVSPLLAQALLLPVLVILTFAGNKFLIFRFEAQKSPQ
jgi:putative flippase GtrA